MTKVVSVSEQHGLAALRKEDFRILSVGISTGGDAEMKMAAGLPGRKIVATTLDEKGLSTARTKIQRAGFGDSIETKIEDVSQNPLPYPDDSFDYIYARLVLHYLSAQKLEVALSSLYRVLKTGGRIFVVVRSTDSAEAQQSDNKYDEETKFTTYTTPSSTVATRYFHTQESITTALVNHGFQVLNISQYDESLSPSFNRDNDVWVMNNLIEVLAEKPLG